MNTTNVQNRAIDELLSAYSNNYSSVLLNAPTGSGKTFMLSSFISRLIESNSNEKLIFVIVTLSSSELPKQLTKKFREYNDFLNTPLNIEHKEPPSKMVSYVKDYESVILAEKNKVFILGKSSFTKKTIFYERGVIKGFLEQIRNENYKLIYIRDEAHYGNTRESWDSEDKKAETQMQDSASFILEMTATPKYTPGRQVIIRNSELIDNGERLIKQTELKNTGIKELQLENISDLDLLQSAINQFKILKEEYIDYSIQNEQEINPAMLIQVDSKTQKTSKQFIETLASIKKKLNKNNLSWLQYFGDEKISSTKETYSLQDISLGNSSVDVIIFKIGPAIGWDIPRAAMLVQMRKVNSLALNIQTLGRIRRNPSKRLEYNSIIDKYYLYSNYQKPTRNQETYLLKSVYEKLNFKCGKIDRKKITKNNFDYDSFGEWFSENFESEEKLNWFKKSYENDFKNNEPVLLILNDVVEDRFSFGYYKEKIIDLIDLKLYNLNFEKKHKDYFIIVKPILLQFIEKQGYENDKGLYIFNRYFFQELFGKYRNVKEKMEFSNYHSIVSKMPEYYIIWDDQKKEKVNFHSINEIYGFNNANNDDKYVQTMDSIPEIIVMKYIINKFNNKNKADNNVFFICFYVFYKYNFITKKQNF